MGSGRVVEDRSSHASTPRKALPIARKLLQDLKSSLMNVTVWRKRLLTVEIETSSGEITRPTSGFFD